MDRKKWISLLLAFVLLLTGCSGVSFEEFVGDLNAEMATPFAEMQYTRPDMGAVQQALESCCDNAQTESDVQALLEQIFDFYGQYNSFYTNYNLANIHYFRDMTDAKWEAEYSFCMQNASTMEAALEQLLYALAACPLKDELEQHEAFGEGFFDSYVGTSIWDETFTNLMAQEAALVERYYDLCAAAQAVPYYSDAFFTQYGTPMAQVYVELIALRQEIAAYAGYEDYPSFAYDFYHVRDYTPVQAEKYLREIQQELVPLYRQVEERGLDVGSLPCDEKAAFAYIKDFATAMGGTVRNAFVLLETAGLYDITYSDKKYDGSFEVYLTDYAVPYVFVNPSGLQDDKLTFAHEFGHFCHDYASGGSISCVDVAEVFSQGMEYLSLCYGENTAPLVQIKMADCLRIFVEQAAYALFEQQVYQLQGENLTVENVCALYEKIGNAFGFDMWDWDSRDFVLIGHYFSDPMYIVSYVVSNDAALQLYQMEQAQAGTGLARMEEQLTTTQTGFLAFLEEAGLESPFAPERLTSVRQTLEAALT